jgi:hypothetical protein
MLDLFVTLSISADPDRLKVVRDGIVYIQLLIIDILILLYWLIGQIYYFCILVIIDRITHDVRLVYYLWEGDLLRAKHEL